MSSIVFGGRLQLITTTGCGRCSGLMIVLTILVVNLRHALYSATIAPFYPSPESCMEGVLAYLLTDEAFVVSILRTRV
jgi:predicted branched-subunit amino acid permease